MPGQNGGEILYQVHGSGVILDALREIQRQAAQEGRGDQVLAAFRKIVQRLQIRPLHAGEALYRLPALRLQVRSIAVRPLMVDYGVSEQRPLVFLRAVKLLPDH